jgi:hypothetical protein
MGIVQTTTARVAHVREKNPTEADALSGLSTQLQLCAAAVLTLDFSNSDDIDSRLSKGRGRKALEFALNSEAKVFLMQSPVRHFMKRKWCASWKRKAALVPTPILEQ